MYVKYADLIFKIACDAKIEIAEAQSTHRSFFLPNDDVKSPDFTVPVEIQRFILGNDAEKIFSIAGAPWSLHKWQDKYYIISNFGGIDPANWTIEFAPKKLEIKIYYDGIILKKSDGKEVIPNPFRYPLDQALMILVLAHKEGIILHAAGIDIEGKGYLFPGQSGAGKSTFSNLCLKHGLTNWLSDDRMIIRKTKNEFFAYGTPWPGTANIAVNAKAPLSTIFFVAHGDKGADIGKMCTEAAIKQLFPVASIPWYDYNCTTSVFGFIEDLAQSIPAYDLRYKPGLESFNIFKRFVSLNNF